MSRDDLNPEDGQEYYEDGEIASWKDVLYYMWFFFKEQWCKVITHFLLFGTFAYMFIFGQVLLRDSATILGGCNASLLLDKSDNPVTLVMAGAISTAIFQSSLTTNVIVGSLVGDVLPVQHGIFILMGANLGNSFVNSLIAVAHFGDKSLLERAVAGACINDIYYLLTIAVWLPIEWASGLLYKIGDASLPVEMGGMNFRWIGLVEMLVHPLSRRLIMPNESLFSSVAGGDIDMCDDIYPITCEDGIESYETCAAGLVGCNPENGWCPFFFKVGATRPKDEIVAALTTFIAVVCIGISLYGMIKLCNKLLINTPVEVVAKLSNQHPVVLLLSGCLSSMLFISSAITETAVIPFVATGIIELEQMLPWCLGSNVGLAVTTMLTAWYSGNANYLHVAIANLFFNVFGALIWYPLRFMREFPLHAALIIGIMVRMWRFFALLYLVWTFAGLPFMVWGIGRLLQNENTGILALGGLIITFIGLIVGFVVVSWFWCQGREKFIAFFEKSGAEGGGEDKQRNPEVKEVRDDESVDSFYANDYDTDDYGSDMSSIGFEVVPKEQLRGENSKLKTPTRLSQMRAAAPPPPAVGRKRLLKNIAGTEKEEQCCCNDQTFFAA